MSHLKAWGIRTAFIFLALASFVVDVSSQQGNTHDNSLDERALETVNSSASSGNTSQIITIPLTLPSGATPLEMVLIQPGTFMMGSPSSEKDRKTDESLQHQVTISNSFFMGKYEVTQAQWQTVMGSNPSNFKGDNLPVETVSWNDCQIFIQKLNQLGKGTFRLPTEAEWEYACRAGTSTRFYWGDDLSYTQVGEYAWYLNNSNSKTNNVGLKTPNAFGLYDMIGNVWELCQDWYGNYSSNVQTDPAGAISGSNRVNRGGSFDGTASNTRSASRTNASPDISRNYLGFRLVTNTDPQSININTSVNFPDTNFRTFIEGYMGVGKNGAFSMNETAKMTKAMDCSNKNISSLKGIEYFTNLTVLDFHDNQITDVDLSKNTALTKVECRRCTLRNLDTSKLVNLEILLCCANNLSKIDVSSSQKLKSIDCGWNQIASIDLTKNLELTFLLASWNPLDNLDVSGNKNLNELYCNDTYILTLDITSNSNLAILQASNCNLTEIKGIEKLPLVACDVMRNYFTGNESWISKLSSKLGDAKYIDGDFRIKSGFAFYPLKININTTENFPDSNFRKFIEGYMGVASGGAFTTEQAAAKTDSLECIALNIKTIKGIEYFSNIARLSVFGNPIDTLDLSKNPALPNLECRRCNISSLNISVCTKLEWAWLGENPLTSLDITHNPNLYFLSFRDAGISTLDVSNNKKLTHLDISKNKFTDISQFLNLPLVNTLDIRNNYLGADDQTVIQYFQSKLKSPIFNSYNELDSGFAYDPQNVVTPTPTLTPVPTSTSTPTITPIPSSTPTCTPTPSPVQNDGFVIGGTELSISPGKDIIVSIQIHQLPETNSITLDLIYDSQVLTWKGSIDKNGTLISNWGLVDANLVSEGRIRISGIAVIASSVKGDGVLINVPFNVQSPLNVSESQITFENLKDGLLGAIPTPVKLKIVKGKKGDVNGDGEITAADAQRTFEFAISRKTPTEDQKWAADVNGDGDITAADAQKIFEVVLGKSTISAKVTNKISLRNLFPFSSEDITIPTVNGTLGQEIQVPVTVNLSHDLTSFTFTLEYDKDKLLFNRLDKSNTLIKGFLLVDANESEPGKITIAGAALTANPVTGSGTLVNLFFTLKNDSTGKAEIKITSVKDDLSDVSITNGGITSQTPVNGWKQF